MFGQIKKVLETRKWRKLAEEAKLGTKLTGFYNDNYKLFYKDKAYLFRFPIKDAPKMDPRMFSEEDAMTLIQEAKVAVPAMIYDDPEGLFHVQEYIDGFTVENRFPAGQKMPDYVIDQIVDFYKKRAGYGIQNVQFFVKDEWKNVVGDYIATFPKLIEYSESVFQRNEKTHAKYYEFLKIGEDPYAYFRDNAKKLAVRPTRLIHADIHRGNLMVDNNQKLWFIDWELGLYADLLMCMAAHIHRTRYSEFEKKDLIIRLKAAMPDEFLVEFDKDLEFYLSFEALKSVITDTVRFPEIMREERFSAKKEADLCMYYADNLTRVSGIIGCRTATPNEAMIWFREWGEDIHHDT